MKGVIATGLCVAVIAALMIGGMRMKLPPPDPDWREHLVPRIPPPSLSWWIVRVASWIVLLVVVPIVGGTDRTGLKGALFALWFAMFAFTTGERIRARLRVRREEGVEGDRRTGG